jgi:arylamine N-acetyltransferase
VTEPPNATGADSFLEALGHERRPPDARFFEDLFLRFQRRVAPETLTRAAGDESEFDPEAFAAEWIEEERGLVAGERVRMFQWLARGCGFEVAALPAESYRPWEDQEDEDSSNGRGRGAIHSILIATIDGKRVLADAGFPLPVLVPLDPPPAEIPTGMGSLFATVERDGSARIACDARGDVTDLLHVPPTTKSDVFPFEEISRTSPGGSPTPDENGAFALRLLDDRVLFWRAGRMTILDAWSRLDYPLAASERAVLARLFALELEGVALPDEPARRGPARLSVFHRSPLPAAEARRRAAKEIPDLTLVTGHEILVEQSGGGSRVEVRATLSPTLPPEGPGEAVRKTLVFHLASGLFASGS